MSPVVHYEIELLYETTYRAACGVHSAKHSYTTDDAQVTCGKCLTALGYEAAPIERLTVCSPDPMREAA
jgi:hypothetical protein